MKQSIAEDVTTTPRPGDTIAVWFSCGAASAVALKMAIEKYPQCNVRAINNPVKEEDEDNRRFLRDVSEWLDVEIEQAASSEFPSQSAVEVWRKRKYMEGISGAPCTQELKKKARQEWERRNQFEWIVIGFTAEEKDRHERFILTERNDVIPILIDGGVTKAECYEIVSSAGISLPRVYRMGYPNANCIGCVKATSPTYWNHVRKTHPEVFKARADQSREIGAKLVRHKGERIFLDELPETAQGRPMKTLATECGIFCEEST